MNKNSLIFVLITFFSVIGAYAQVGINTENPSANAALHIEANGNSSTLMMPKLTDGEGNAIVPVSGENGMMYFNTTTGCFHYYAEQYGTWLTICGTLPPAKLEFNDCGAIKINGVYIGGIPLAPSNYISVPVTVITPGTYEIMAEVMSPPNSGAYFFYASGTFNSAGTYVINLMGTGTPTVQPTALADDIMMLANKTAVLCMPTVNVLSPQPSYRIVSAVANPSEYPINTVFDNSADALSYFASVQLQVVQPGVWQLATSNINGYSFSGQGNISEASGYNPNGTFPQIVTVQVPAHGEALQYTALGRDTFLIGDLNSATPSTFSFPVKLAKIHFSIDCSNINLGNIGTLQQNTVLPSGSKITARVNITSIGETTLTASFAGVIYQGDIDETLGTGIHDIELTPAAGQKPNTNGTAVPISFNSSDGGLVGTICQPTVNIAAAISAFTVITPNPSVYAATIDPITNNNSLPNITLKYTANTAGAYTLTTTNNGITYSGTGNVQVGSGQITLTPSGTPTKNGTVNYTLNYDSDGDGTPDKPLTFSVIYQYRPVNILSLGFADYAPSGTRPDRAPTQILASAANFGPTGRYCVGQVNLVNGGTNMDNALINSINNNKIDVIVVGWGYNPDATSANILADFVKNKKGVLIFCDESTTENQRMLNTLYTAINATSPNLTVASTGGPYSCQLESIDDPVLNGIFGDARGGYLGQDAGTGWQYTISALPPTAQNLATGQSGQSAMFRDNTWGFLYVADGGWMIGIDNDTNKGSYPASTTGSPNYIPVTKQFFHTDGTNTPANTVNVANSIIYANAVAWAIDYVFRNEVPDYQVDSNYAY